MLQEFPNLRFINGCLGGNFASLLWFIANPQNFREWLGWRDLPYEQFLKQLYYDIASPNRYPAEITYNSQVLGANRILYGTDYPVQRGLMAEANLLVNGLEEGLKKKICSENATALFGR